MATTLTEHEKSLDELIRRLEDLSRTLSTNMPTNLSRISAEIQPREPAVVKRVSEKKEIQETLVYIKLKIDRPTEELKSILDSLKE